MYFLPFLTNWNVCIFMQVRINDIIINGLGYYTYTKLNNNGVCPILDYFSDNRRKLAMFRYVNRLIDMDDSRLPKIVFKWDVDIINSW